MREALQYKCKYMHPVNVVFRIVARATVGLYQFDYILGKRSKLQKMESVIICANPEPPYIISLLIPP